MKIKQGLIYVSCLLLFTTCGSDPVTNILSPEEPETPEHITANILSADRPTDMVLIYHGYKNRPAWTASDMKPYIFRTNDGKTEWLFDGFFSRFTDI